MVQAVLLLAGVPLLLFLGDHAGGLRPVAGPRRADRARCARRGEPVAGRSARDRGRADGAGRRRRGRRRLRGCQWPVVTRSAAPTGSALDETIRKAEQLARVEFSVFVGNAEGEPRAFARRLHAALVAPARSILIMVDPTRACSRSSPAATSAAPCSDSEVELAIAEMQSDVRRRRPGRRAPARHPDARRARPGARRPCTRDRSLMGAALVGVIGRGARRRSSGWPCVAFFRSIAEERARAAEAEASGCASCSTRSRRSPGPTGTSRPSCPRSSSTRSAPTRARTGGASCPSIPGRCAGRTSLRPMANGHCRTTLRPRHPDPRHPAAGRSGSLLPALRPAVHGVDRAGPGLPALQGWSVHLQAVLGLHPPVEPGLRRARGRALRLPGVAEQLRLRHGGEAATAARSRSSPRTASR